MAGPPLFNKAFRNQRGLVFEFLLHWESEILTNSVVSEWNYSWIYISAYGSGNPLLRQMGPSAIMAHASAMVNGSYCGEHISSHSPSDSDRQTGSPDLTLSGSSPLPGQVSHSLTPILSGYSP